MAGPSGPPSSGTPVLANIPVVVVSGDCSAPHVAFTLGAILPLFPWFFTSGATGVVLSIAIGGVSALLLGALIGAMAGRSVVGTALRQLVVAALAAAVTFGVGHLLGVQAT